MTICLCDRVERNNKAKLSSGCNTFSLFPHWGSANTLVLGIFQYVRVDVVRKQINKKWKHLTVDSLS